MTRLFLTFLVGLLGGCLLYRLKVPGGMMVGAILSVSLLNILSGIAVMPSAAKVVAQSLAGTFIACSVDKSDLQSLPKLWRPACALIILMLAINLLAGTAIYFLSPMDILTAMLCAVPGGMSDTPIIAADMGADAGKVAVMQFLRMSTGIGIFPSILIRFTKRGKISPNICAASQQTPKKHTYGLTPFLLTLVVAFFCGGIGKCSGIPAGTLVFSLLGVLAFKSFYHQAYLPMWTKRLAQVLSGAYIGCGISKSDLLELKYMIVPAFILLIGYFLSSIMIGHILNRFFQIPLDAAMLAATPAGASDMALISSDLGVNSKEVIELQIIRMVVVIVVFPQVIYHISCFVGG